MSMSLKDDILNAVRESKINKTCRCKTPRFRKPAPPPLPNPNLGWQPTKSLDTKPPTTGSNAVKPNPAYTPPPSVKTTCTYITPCGWCTKWDKKCDMKIGCDKDKDLNKIKFGCGLILTDLHSTTSSGVRKENTK